VGIGQSHVGSVVAFGQLHVGKGAVGVEGHLLEGTVLIGPGVVSVIVPENVPSAGIGKLKGLFMYRRYCFRQIVGGGATDHDAVTVGAETVIRGVVEIAVAHTQRKQPRSATCIPLIVPSVCTSFTSSRLRWKCRCSGVLAVVGAGGAALKKHCLDAGPFHDGGGNFCQLRRIRRRAPVVPVQR